MKNDNQKNGIIMALESNNEPKKKLSKNGLVGIPISNAIAKITNIKTTL
jgi:hypothetical protein